MEAGQAVHLAEHLVAGSRGQLDETDQRQRHRDQNGVDRAHRHHAQGGEHRQRHLAPVDLPDVPQRADIEQRERREHQHRAQRGDGTYRKGSVRKQQHRRDGCGGDQTGDLRRPPAESAMAVRAAAHGDGKTPDRAAAILAAPNAANSRSTSILVAVLRRKAAGGQYAAGKEHHGQTRRAGNESGQVFEGNGRPAQRRQSGGNWKPRTATPCPSNSSTATAIPATTSVISAAGQRGRNRRARSSTAKLPRPTARVGPWVCGSLVMNSETDGE